MKLSALKYAVVALAGFCAGMLAEKLPISGSKDVTAELSHKIFHVSIDEVRALRALSGYRGKPRGDLDALADALVALSQLATKPALRVLEAEINPLIVRAEGEGVVPVDALVRVAASMRNV